MMQLAERNYEIYNKELLAIVEALTKWKQYLLDTTDKFKVWTDHENLKYFREPQKLNGWQARWYLKLQDYDFTLWHIPGKTNTKADILSRKDQVNTQDDNKNVQMLKEELWTRRMMAKITMLQRNIVKNSSLLEEIWRNNTREYEIEQELKKKNSLAWEQDRIIYMNRQIYIPNNKKIKEQIL